MTVPDNYQMIKREMGSEMIVQQFAEILGEREAKAYMASVLLSVRNNDALAKCTPHSILREAMRAATLRLLCDPALGQAYLLPFKGKATLMVGYKGLINLAYRTKRYRYINANVLYTGEDIEIDRITGAAKLTGSKKGNEIEKYFAFFELTSGLSKTLVMTVAEIREHAQKYSASFTYKDSPWNTHFDDMARKTVLRQLLSKWGDFNPTDWAALTDVDPENVPDEEPIDAETVSSEPEPPQSLLQNMSDLGFDTEPPAEQVSIFAGGRKSAPQP